MLCHGWSRTSRMTCSRGSRPCARVREGQRLVEAVGSTACGGRTRVAVAGASRQAGLWCARGREETCRGEERQYTGGQGGSRAGNRKQVMPMGEASAMGGSERHPEDALAVGGRGRALVRCSLAVTQSPSNRSTWGKHRGRTPRGQR